MAMIFRAASWCLSLVVVLGALSACGRPPPATPTMAEATKDVVVCWSAKVDGPDPDDIGLTAEQISLRHAIERRLTGAGYALSHKKCDVRIRWNNTWGRARGEERSYHASTLTLFTPKGEVIDVVQYEFERDHFPVEEPDRLAIMFVNSMNASPKMSAFAARRRSEKTSSQPGGSSTDL
jgi:hypothetical protein